MVIDKPRVSIDGIDDAYSNGESLFALMNIHHLELFYYVATHRGVSAAARHIPYGIQQPAISAQILQLEQQLGVALFRRRPFDLTDEGRRVMLRGKTIASKALADFFGVLGAEERTLARLLQVLMTAHGGGCPEL